MSVVINEFEVLEPAQPTGASQGTPAGAAPAPAPLEPHDLRQLLAVNAELQLRRLAH